MLVTVGPGRYTPAVMKACVSSFGTATLGLSGNREAVAQAGKSCGAYAAKHQAAEGDPEMDHSSIIYVVGRQGRYAAIFTHQNSSDRIAAKLMQLRT